MKRLTQELTKEPSSISSNLEVFVFVFVQTTNMTDKVGVSVNSNS